MCSEDDDVDDVDDEMDDDDDGRSRTYTERTSHTTATSTWQSHRSGDKEGDGGRLSSASAHARGKGGWKQLEQKPLSKLERANLDAAKMRHKDSIAAPKVRPEWAHRVSPLVSLLE